MDNNNLYGSDTQNNQYQQSTDPNSQYQSNYQQPADTNNQYQQNTYYQQGGAVQQPDKASGMAIASMICGILSILCCCVWYISIILAIVAIVLGIVNNSKKMGGRGMAIAGIVTGAVGIVCVVIFLILIVMGMASSDFSYYMNNY